MQSGSSSATGGGGGGGGMDVETGTTSGRPGQNPKIQQMQNQVSEVVDIMRVNVEKVMDRDVKLGELDERAEGLEQGAQGFAVTSRKLHRKFWWQNIKMWLVIIVIVIVIIAIIAIVIASKVGGGGGGGGGDAGGTTSTTTVAANT